MNEETTTVYCTKDAFTEGITLFRGSYRKDGSFCGKRVQTHVLSGPVILRKREFFPTLKEAMQAAESDRSSKIKLLERKLNKMRDMTIKINVPFSQIREVCSELGVTA